LKSAYFKFPCKTEHFKLTRYIDSVYFCSLWLILANPVVIVQPIAIFVSQQKKSYFFCFFFSLKDTLRRYKIICWPLLCLLILYLLLMKW